MNCSGKRVIKRLRQITVYVNQNDIIQAVIQRDRHTMIPQIGQEGSKLRRKLYNQNGRKTTMLLGFMQVCVEMLI
jgi:hypothetical protein